MKVYLFMTIEELDVDYVTILSKRVKNSVYIEIVLKSYNNFLSKSNN